jgi:hypothetical protein
MAITESFPTGNGTTGPYSFNFPYLDTTDVKVSVNGSSVTEFSLPSQYQILFTSLTPSASDVIRIYRQTDDSNLSATFYPGSAIRSQDLNDNFTQTLYVAQETATFAAGTDASSVASDAATALSNSQQAISTANNAETVANGIAATANQASTDAAAAVSTANTASSTATAAQTTANAALPKAGGTMTGDIVFNTTQTYPKVPQNAKTAAYTLVAADAGKHISITTGGITVPSGVFAVGDAVSIYNNSGSSQTITQGTSATLRLAGSASTGNRTLSQYGLCTILCVASNTFVVSGAIVS